MDCTICEQPGGFHEWQCTSYLMIHLAEPELVGPGNSQQFMAWLRARLEEKRKK